MGIPRMGRMRLLCGSAVPESQSLDSASQVGERIKSRFGCGGSELHFCYLQSIEPCADKRLLENSPGNKGWVWALTRVGLSGLMGHQPAPQIPTLLLKESQVLSVSISKSGLL